ncbi:MAG: ribonuclease HI [Alphaproteobacteria bacterium]|nr:MAG: ribonuclease HI [Alphaproteobacteria bacterium]
MSLPNVVIYTDGACSGNPGPGGWGAVLTHGDTSNELSGFEPETTNNRMELMAAIEALRALKKTCAVTIVTDSRYVQDGITQWVHGWQSKGWKTAANKPVKNIDLWQALLEAVTKHTVTWEWIKGHSGHELNERADALARNAIIQAMMAG